MAPLASRLEQGEVHSTRHNLGVKGTPLEQGTRPIKSAPNCSYFFFSTIVRKEKKKVILSLSIFKTTDKTIPFHPTI